MEGTDGIMAGAGMNWRKSSYSGNGGTNCVEVAAANVVLVRDSKNPEGAKLAFNTASWKAFTARVKASLADLLLEPVGVLSCLEVPLRRVRGRFRGRRRAGFALYACSRGSFCAFHGHSCTIDWKG